VPAAVTQAQADESLRKADAFATAGDKVKARLAYTEALKAGYKGPRLEELKDKLTALSDEVLFSGQPCPEAITYTVSAADSAGLASIAKRYDTTYQLIARINRKRDANIRVGETLKIIPGPFDAVVHKRTFRLEVYLKGAFIKRYRIGLGLNGSTPEGEFKVTSKLIKPAWFRPGGEVPYGDPENPLGTRWIGFVNEYGIHGTWEPESIGKEGSRGCVRMLNADVEELYDLLVTGKSRVTVLP
jgi:lipoprotein-anchoring transpeptidase ErfK/SrfK